MRFGNRISRHVRPKVARRTPPHASQNLAVQHDDSDIETFVFNKPLDVQDGIQSHQCPERAMCQVWIADSHDSAAFGAEQRLHHDIASQVVKGMQGVIFVLANDRVRHGESSLLQPSRRQILVDSTLQRFRRIDDLRSRAFDSPQDVHAIDHLFERPRWHRSDDEEIEWGGGQRNVGRIG